MGKVTSNAEFRASRDCLRQLVVVVGTGDATLQAKGDASNWVTVDDGLIAADKVITFYAVSDQIFRVTLTGTAQAWLAG